MKTRLGVSLRHTESVGRKSNFPLLIALQKRYIDGNEILEVNDIRSIYGKDPEKIQLWIEKGKLLYADIKEMRNFLSGGPIPPADKKSLISGDKYNTKIVDDQIFLQKKSVKLSGLVSGYDGKTHSFGDGGVDKTVADAWKVIMKHHHQVRKLAEKLKGFDVLTSAKNIWDFSNRIAKGGNINYHNDDSGKEQLRTPARTWHDREKGVDCPKDSACL